VKVEKISNTYVRDIDTEKHEVRLEGSEVVYRYADGSIILLLQKAMTRKATFIVHDRVISWIELKGRGARKVEEPTVYKST
jgi:hypothetical protein